MVQIIDLTSLVRIAYIVMFQSLDQFIGIKLDERSHFLSKFVTNLVDCTFVDNAQVYSTICIPKGRDIGVRPVPWLPTAAISAAAVTI